ncbi:MAG: FeoB-associated Cys-rich membrane protein [Oscillospiraceae bacterium]|nr:FeoB-associated Cys-rich membrane protein [Oscillospiraceae bacterium]
MGTFVVSVVVISIMGLAVRKIYLDRKSGKGCGGGCKNCSKFCNSETGSQGI